MNSTWTSDQIKEYGLQYRRVEDLKTQLATFIAANRIGTGFLGMIGFFLILTILHGKEFKAVSFIYHRSIAFMDLLQTFIAIDAGIRALTGLHKYSYPWYFFAVHLGWNLGNGFALTADMLTLIVSSERIVALWFPTLFPKINRKRIAISLRIFAYCFSVCYIPDSLVRSIYYNNNTLSYGYASRPNQPFTSYSAFRDKLEMAKGFAIIITTVGVISGFIRKFRLTQASGNANQSAWKLDKQLCYLQLAISVPVAINSLLFSIWYQNGPSFVTLVEASKLEFPQAIRDLEAVAIYAWLQMLVSLSNQIGHCSNFYLYAIFSAKFRDGVASLLCCRQPTPVVPISRSAWSVKEKTRHQEETL